MLKAFRDDMRQPASRDFISDMAWGAGAAIIGVNVLAPALCRLFGV